MAKFKINESGKVYEIEVRTDRNEDATNDFVELYETENGEVASRLDEIEADEEGFDYRIGSDGFEAMLEAFEEMEAEQDDVLSRVSVWSDYR